MDLSAFKKECFDYVDSCFEEFEKTKQVMADIFKVFQRLCKNHNLVYYAAFGTLLGSIRDNGFIPWDADIDVMIPSNEIHKLVDLLNKELPEGYYYVSNFNDIAYPFCQIRVCKKGYNSFAYHLDVFYMIGYPSNPKKQVKFDKMMMKLFYRRYAKYEKVTPKENASKKIIYFCKLIRKLFLGVISKKRLEKECRKLIFKYNFEDSDFFTVFCHTNYKLPKSALNPAQLIKCESFDEKVYVPKDSKTLLNIFYHEDISYLPISCRFKEFYESFLRIKNSKDGDIL